MVTIEEARRVHIEGKERPVKGDKRMTVQTRGTCAVTVVAFVYY
jgi:hypothetical protein